MMNDEQLLRYSRQIMMPEVEIAGQERLLASRVLVIGLGGLGCPVAIYLAAAGVGELVLVDDDRVELTNLQRQIAHFETDIGRSKVESAAATLAQVNSGVRVTTRHERLDEGALAEAVAGVDLVVDATDNFATRFAINRACVAHQKPLVSGAAIGLSGQISVFDVRHQDSPCYRCLYREEGTEEQSCARNGVLAPVVGMIGTMQALEAIKVLAGIGTPLQGRLLMLDAAAGSWRELKLRRDPACPCCGSR
ncbi:HesA/MoeB/ThiF family protein [Aestuariirhabdus litorea]|uniref:Molybdopterin-synthase adenylyltransferase n=1 Tax=Aestuariirhabdus litorea TaxID=2528527 RepID=A0A3P3VSB5_9GAMM|nr:molybdopterin-synthase adenylyltransferase MoeB [Aestuariirhabdus litorea]RRJ83693.1 molybdopterin-synthase adenylyltransferase MoeB [Aestuariirhabdus litorea]RWW96915.1 molybdopterin-synthase adenylyltransferase MoeB [Endozoicomonadaceae bacterium GTF-13]